MKKFKQMVRGRKGGNQENSSQEQERKLCLQHLRKLFLEFLHPLEPMTRDQQERRLHLMLPLFLRVFLESEPSEMSERFGDVLQFAGHTSRLLVNEVQRRAANKPKVEAGREIILFLMRKPPEQGNYGWNLISTLNVLARGEISIIECMVAAQLPSNLVKMIKLFFYLPDKIISEEQTSEIKKKVMPTLTELCHHTITAKELIRTDDLAELFDALTCSSQPQHDIWRTGVSEILTAITRNCLTREVIEYIYGMYNDSNVLGKD